MKQFNPFKMGTRGPVIKTTHVVNGTQVPAVMKSPWRVEYYKAADAEAEFLREASDRRVKGVPKFYAYDRPHLTMEFVEGRQFMGMQFGGVDSLQYPEDLELQVKILPWYIRTMDHIARATSKVKPIDNKEVDIVIVNESLRELGDMVILDWGTVERADKYNRNLFLADTFTYFGLYPGEEADAASDYTGFVRNTLGEIDPYVRALRSLEEAMEGQRRDPKHPFYPAEIGRRGAEIGHIEGTVQQWLASAPATPLRTLAQGLFEMRYGHDQEGFIRDLVGFYSWADGLNRRFTPSDIARREQAFHDVLRK